MPLTQPVHRYTVIWPMSQPPGHTQYLQHIPQQDSGHITSMDYQMIEKSNERKMSRQYL